MPAADHVRKDAVQVRGVAHARECQLVTNGTDRKVSYWEVSDGSLIRELLESRFGSVNSLHATDDGQFFVTGCDDRLLKLWTYYEVSSRTSASATRQPSR